MMTHNDREKLITEIVALLQAKLTVNTVDTVKSDKPAPQPIEMLTIKECSAQIRGLSEHTVRQLVAQGKIKSIRSGQGKRGKILVSKSALLGYFSNGG